MHKSYFAAALLGAGLLAVPLSAHAQADKQLLYLGTGLGLGVGRYNDLDLSTGLNLRFQQPLGAGFSLTARTGGDFSVVKGKEKDYYRYYYGTTSGFSIPLTVGPRFYIVDGLHTDLNVGVDLGVTELTSTSLHFEPAVGYTLPLANSHYLDLGISLITSFEQGSGVFSFNLAYAFNLGGLAKGRAARPAPAAAPSPAYSPVSPPLPLPSSSPASSQAAPPMRQATPAAPRRATPALAPRRRAGT